jgi:2-methylisocitrate lyase-like PEP mutase family enzyme
MGAGRELRELLIAGRPVVAPGAYDGLTASLVERSGYRAVYMTGAGTAAALGLPDYGLVTMTEMAANVARLTSSTRLPVIADADTGYGNELNVVRTVREYERAGAAALHIEDQVFSKRCGHLDGKELVPLDEFAARIHAAADSRSDPDLLIIARTDAIAVEGFDAAVERARAALAAGADLAFVEAPETEEQVARIPALVGGPCLLNLVAGGKTPAVSVEEAGSFGYVLVIVPGLLLASTVIAAEIALTSLKETGRFPKAPAGAPSGPRELFSRVGADDWDELRKRLSGVLPAAHHT